MNADTTSPHIFTIPAPNLSRLQERIAELNRRAKRIESPDIAIETLSVDPSRDTLGAVTLVYRVRVSGTAPKVAGWTFAAVLEHTEDGTIIRTVPGAAIEESTVARYRDVPPRCEYCNTVRRRLRTVLQYSQRGGTSR